MGKFQVFNNFQRFEYEGLRSSIFLFGKSYINKGFGRIWINERSLEKSNRNTGYRMDTETEHSSVRIKLATTQQSTVMKFNAGK